MMEHKEKVRQPYVAMFTFLLFKQKVDSGGPKVMKKHKQRVNNLNM